MFKPILSIIIASYNTADLTVECIKSIKRDKRLDFDLNKLKDSETIPSELIIVDNNSEDDSVEKIKKCQWVNLIENKKNIGFGGANNQGVAKSKGNYLLFLNSDTIVLHGAISQSLDWLASHPEAGICTAQLLNKDKTIQASGGYFPNLANVATWSFGLDDLPLVNKIIAPLHPHTPDFYLKDRFYLGDRKLDWVTGAFIMARRELIEGVGGFDEDYFMYGEELEMIYRIKKKFANYECHYLVGPQVIHLGGASTLNKSYPIVKEIEGIEYFFKKHKSVLEYKLVKWMLRLNPSIRLRAFFYSLVGRKDKAAYYNQICSKI